MVQGLSPAEHKGLLLSVGTHRGKRPLSPVEVAMLFKRAADAGASLRDLAELVHFDGTTMVSRFLRLLELNPEIQHLIDWGQSGSTIAFSAASELSRLDTGEQVGACTAVLENQLSSAEVKELVQLRLRSQQSLPDCIAAVLRMRPRIEKRHLLIGAVMAEGVRIRLRTMTQAERDALFQQVLLELLSPLDDYSGRLGVERFTISGNEAVAERLTSGQADFEGLVVRALVAKLPPDSST
jgi:hypothetical protein